MWKVRRCFFFFLSFTHRTNTDGGHYFIAVKAVSERSAFGAPLNEIDLVDDNGLMIPAVLVVMKRYLYDQQGLNQEGA